MAIHTRIRKIFDSTQECIYALSSDLRSVACFAKINKLEKRISFYKNERCKDLIFEYILEQKNDQPLSNNEFKLFIVHGLQKIIPALKHDNFPDYLDKCS